MSITIYSKPACTQCTQTKRQLDRAGVEYVELDVTKDTDNYTKALSYGFRSFPIVVTDNSSWGGLDLDKIQEYIKSKKGAVTVEVVTEVAQEDCGCGV